MKKQVLVTALSVLAMAFTAFPAYAGYYQTSDVVRTDSLNQAQFDQILNTLRSAQDSKNTYQFVNTGIRGANCAEAEKICDAFEQMFMGQDDYYILSDNKGAEAIRLDENSNGNSYTYWSTNCGSREPYSIYVIWKPDSAPEECLMQHDIAKKEVDKILALAPSDAYEKVKYFNDTLANKISYDWEGLNAGNAKHASYYGLVEGKCVCSGYAEAFFNLCYYSGCYAAYAPCITEKSSDGTPDHAINAVNLDGTWKKVDVTWNDQEYGIIYNYFMKEMSESWQNSLNYPVRWMES